MKASVVAGSLLSGLMLIAAPMPAQQVSADVVIRGGPVAGHVVVGNGYSTYRRPVERRAVVVGRYAPRVVLVERVHRHQQARYWSRHGFRPVTLYYLDGRYYDRRVGRARQVVVYHRGSRYYEDCGRAARHSERGHDGRGHGHRDHERNSDHRFDDWDD